MIERSAKRYVSCPICGRVLMKGRGVSDIEVTCNKCRREISVIIEEERVSVFENRRGTENDRHSDQVRISVPKGKTSMIMRG